MKNSAKLLITGSSLLLAPSALAEIVYEDTFDAQDGIAINTGTGGGLVSGTNIGAADPFDDASGVAVPQSDFGNRIAWAHTENQFPLTAGFTLNVTFTTAATGNPSFTSSFGIVDEVTAATPDVNDVGITGNLNAYLYSDQESLNTVGFSAANRPENTNDIKPGLYADFGTLASVSDALNDAIVLGTTQTFSLTVNADGSATFSLDETSGDLPAGSLSSLFADSADGEYHFVAYSQGNTGLTLNSVSIDAVPVPSTGFIISDIQYSQEDRTVTLTWVSSPEGLYVAKYSRDIENWGADMGDGITMANDDENLNDGNLLTKTFNLQEFLAEDPAKLFFRIESE